MFRFYITNLFVGTIMGTNNQEEAEGLAWSEEYFIVDTSTGEELSYSGERSLIKQFS